MTVAVVTTGGTIASTASAGGAASPELSGEDLLAAIPELDGLTEVAVHEFSNVPSPHFTVEQMYELTELVRDLDADANISGIVITQGTDILEETAYCVDLCYSGDTPVVFTGAMRNPSLPSPDGPNNVLTSVHAVLAARSPPTNVLVAFNERLHAAREVTKMHSMNVDTFRTPELGPIGVRDESRIIWYRTPTHTDSTFSVDAETLTNDVHAVTVTADMPPEQIAVAAESAGLCIAATGAGHIPPTIVPVLEDLTAEQIPLVATTRCPEGRLARDTYGFHGSEQTLQELGAYYSDLNLQKTRIKTLVAIAADQLDEAFERP